MFLPCKSVVFWLLLVWTGAAGACICPNATVVLSLPPSTAPSSDCCLNFSGSALGVLDWAWFSNMSGLEVLDLSHCNITHIHQGAADRGPSSLTKLLLDHNGLRSLPRSLLSAMFNLTELHLEENRLQDLPPDLLQDNDRIQKLHLQRNQLQFLPISILKKSSLTSLELDENPWHCSCEFTEEMELFFNTNRSSDQGALANLTCASPPPLAGRAVLELSLGEACGPTRLTALFIALPLLILSALVLCWCCGRTKSKEAPTFSSKKNHNLHSNGLKHLSIPLPACDSPADPKPESILQNQLLLRPCSALLSSTRDIHQDEVEARLGSADGSLCSSLTESRPDEGPGAELDALSVTDVLRASADREKAYLTQSTEYYSLVPGLQLDDSDHGEFDSVDLT